MCQVEGKLIILSLIRDQRTKKQEISEQLKSFEKTIPTDILVDI